MFDQKRASSGTSAVLPARTKIENLSTRVFETRTATGSELFSLLTCFHTTTLTLLSIFSPLEMIGIKNWETPLSWHAKCSLPVAVRVSKTCMLKLPNKWIATSNGCSVQIRSLELKIMEAETPPQNKNIIG